MNSSAKYFRLPSALIMTAIILVFTALSCHFLSELLGVLSIVFIALNLYKCRLPRAAALCFCLWVASLVAPIDVAVRADSHWRAAYVPVVTATHSSQEIRWMVSRGLIENKDFVVYDRNSELVRARWALMVIVPVRLPFRTPTFATANTVTESGRIGVGHT